MGVGLPSTPLPSGWMDSLGPMAFEVQPLDYIPPPSMERRRENILCSPVDLILERLFPSTPVAASMALMVVPSARMPMMGRQHHRGVGGRALWGPV
jgi:hypothetical protein